MSEAGWYPRPEVEPLALEAPLHKFVEQLRSLFPLDFGGAHSAPVGAGARADETRLSVLMDHSTPEVRALIQQIAETLERVYGGQGGSADLAVAIHTVEDAQRLRELVGEASVTVQSQWLDAGALDLWAVRRPVAAEPARLLLEDHALLDKACCTPEIQRLVLEVRELRRQQLQEQQLFRLQVQRQLQEEDEAPQHHMAQDMEPGEIIAPPKHHQILAQDHPFRMQQPRRQQQQLHLKADAELLASSTPAVGPQILLEQRLGSLPQSIAMTPATASPPGGISMSASSASSAFASGRGSISATVCGSLENLSNFAQEHLLQPGFSYSVREGGGLTQSSSSASLSSTASSMISESALLMDSHHRQHQHHHHRSHPHHHQTLGYLAEVDEDEDGGHLEPAARRSQHESMDEEGDNTLQLLHQRLSVNTQLWEPASELQVHRRSPTPVFVDLGSGGDPEPGETSEPLQEAALHEEGDEGDEDVGAELRLSEELLRSPQQSQYLYQSRLQHQKQQASNLLPLHPDDEELLRREISWIGSAVRIPAGLPQEHLWALMQLGCDFMPIESDSRHDNTLSRSSSQVAVDAVDDTASLDGTASPLAAEPFGAAETRLRFHRRNQFCAMVLQQLVVNWQLRDQPAGADLAFAPRPAHLSSVDHVELALRLGPEISPNAMQAFIGNLGGGDADTGSRGGSAEDAANRQSAWMVTVLEIWARLRSPWPEPDEQEEIGKLAQRAAQLCQSANNTGVGSGVVDMVRRWALLRDWSRTARRCSEDRELNSHRLQLKLEQQQLMGQPPEQQQQLEQQQFEQHQALQNQMQALSMSVVGSRDQFLSHNLPLHPAAGFGKKSSSGGRSRQHRNSFHQQLPFHGAQQQPQQPGHHHQKGLPYQPQQQLQAMSASGRSASSASGGVVMDGGLLSFSPGLQQQVSIAARHSANGSGHATSSHTPPYSQQLQQQSSQPKHALHPRNQAQSQQHQQYMHQQQQYLQQQNQQQQQPQLLNRPSSIHLAAAGWPDNGPVNGVHSGNNHSNNRFGGGVLNLADDLWSPSASTPVSGMMSPQTAPGSRGSATPVRRFPPQYPPPHQVNHPNMSHQQPDHNGPGRRPGSFMAGHQQPRGPRNHHHNNMHHLLHHGQQPHHPSGRHYHHHHNGHHSLPRQHRRPNSHPIQPYLPYDPNTRVLLPACHVCGSQRHAIQDCFIMMRMRLGKVVPLCGYCNFYGHRTEQCNRPRQ